MKHSIKITLILLLMFFLAQLIGLFITSQYSPQVKQITDSAGNLVNITSYNLPYGMDPPPDIKQKSAASMVFSFILAFSFAIIIMFILMKYNAETLFRVWFFFVVALAIGITLNAPFSGKPFASLIALLISLPLSYIKIFKRNIIVHNLTELLIYPGIGAIFIALIFSWTTHPLTAIIMLLIIISIYDIYAVWHSGIMQKMAKYQINKLRIFSGFFVPYLGKKEREIISKLSKSKTQKLKGKKVKVSIAILGGGDVVFPIILAGIVFRQLGILPALIISIGATLALAVLFFFSKKGKFYPAMPFITAGCFIALALANLI
ncbi:MAG: hypothetical protein AABX73_03465 [Nanoarchaeota archaeon]